MKPAEMKDLIDLALEARTVFSREAEKLDQWTASFQRFCTTELYPKFKKANTNTLVANYLPLWVKYFLHIRDNYILLAYGVITRQFQRRQFKAFVRPHAQSEFICRGVSLSDCVVCSHFGLQSIFREIPEKIQECIKLQPDNKKKV